MVVDFVVDFLAGDDADVFLAGAFFAAVALVAVLAAGAFLAAEDV